MASLLTVALHGKLEYFTDILRTLLSDLVAQYVAKNPKLMLRRSVWVSEAVGAGWLWTAAAGSCVRTSGAPGSAEESPTAPSADPAPPNPPVSVIPGQRRWWRSCSPIGCPSASTLSSG